MKNIAKMLGKGKAGELFDPSAYLASEDTIFERVFAPEAGGCPE